MTFRDLRIKTGLSQSKLALKIGITSSAVNQYEKGKRTPDVPTLIKLAKTLNVDEAWLMGFDSPMEPQLANVSNENRFNSDDERTLILSYRKLNDKNKKKCYIYTNTLLTNQQMEDELIVKAAHKYANVDVTEEMKQHADDIMNNPSEWE